MNSQAWVLMTALPPTTGHGDLIEFASQCAPVVNVVLCTQPSEPMCDEREAALRKFAQSAALGGGVRVHRIHAELPQEPADSPDFWDMWRQLLRGLGASHGDVVVASEPYGSELAATIHGEFIPYDLGRVVDSTKASAVRSDPIGNFAQVLPEFQQFLRKRITIFGAESVGKTTITERLYRSGLATTLPEWARPYLELAAVGPQVTPEKMVTIWRGQRALQAVADSIATRNGRPFIAQDTDLYSTIGYWQLKGEEFGEPRVPDELWSDARRLASDLYVILGQDDVPFESDPLRYGGDRRESEDQFWVDLCEQAGLRWVLVDESDLESRVTRVVAEMARVFGTPLNYTRRGAEYESAGMEP